MSFILFFKFQNFKMTNSFIKKNYKYVYVSQLLKFYKIHKAGAQMEQTLIMKILHNFFKFFKKNNRTKTD